MLGADPAEPEVVSGPRWQSGPLVVTAAEVPAGVRQWLSLAGLPVRASYTTEEVARLLHVRLREVHRMIEDGRLSRLAVPQTRAQAGRDNPAIRPTRIPYAALAQLLPADLR